MQFFCFTLQFLLWSKTRGPRNYILGHYKFCLFFQFIVSRSSEDVFFIVEEVQTMKMLRILWPPWAYTAIKTVKIGGTGILKTLKRL